MEEQPNMKSASIKSTFVFSLVVWISLTVYPQSNSAGQPDRVFYGFVAPGVTSLPASRKEESGDYANAVIGAGLEKYLRNRLSFGGEMAESFFNKKLSSHSVAFEPGIFWVQFNGTYHLNFGDGTRRFVPFASAGVGVIALGSEPDTGWNYGAGFHLWTKGRLGVRIEYRRIIEPVGDFRGGSFRTVRFGLAVR